MRGVLIWGAGILGLLVVAIVAIVVLARLMGGPNAFQSSSSGSTTTQQAQGGSANTTPAMLTVRVTGDPGIDYMGNIGTHDTGQKSISGTTSPTPDDYQLQLNNDRHSGDNLTASVSKHPSAGQGGPKSQPGTLTLQILDENGSVLKEQSSSDEMGHVLVNYTPILDRR